LRCIRRAAFSALLSVFLAVFSAPTPGLPPPLAFFRLSLPDPILKVARIKLSQLLEATVPLAQHPVLCVLNREISQQISVAVYTSCTCRLGTNVWPWSLQKKKKMLCWFKGEEKGPQLQTRAMLMLQGLPP